MRARWAFSGLVMAVGVGIGAYYAGWHHVTALRGEEMAGGALTQLRLDIGGLFHRTSAGGTAVAGGAGGSGKDTAGSTGASRPLSAGKSGSSSSGSTGAPGSSGTVTTDASGTGANGASSGVASGAKGPGSATGGAATGGAATGGAAPGASGSGSGSGSGTGGQTPGGGTAVKGSGASTAAPVTTNNAPPPTPTVLDGVKLLYDPFKPSDGPYPTLTSSDHVWIDVSVDQQLAYIMNGDKVLYIMVTSTGIDTKPDNSTPLGVYHIQLQRGTWFYSTQYQMGAKYWVSWLGHGVFLFHSVPMNQNGQVLPDIAARLGHPASHGCFHLTIPDAKWVYDNIPRGTAVVVEQAPVALQRGTIYQPSLMQRAAEQAPATSGSGTSAS